MGKRSLAPPRRVDPKLTLLRTHRTQLMTLRRNDDYPLGVLPRRRTTSSRGLGLRRGRSPGWGCVQAQTAAINLVYGACARTQADPCCRTREGGAKSAVGEDELECSLLLSLRAALGSVLAEDCNARGPSLQK